jgi:hypothetical protein
MTRDKLLEAAIAELATWRTDKTNTAETIALKVYEPLLKGNVSKAEAAEQLARIIDDSPADADFGSKLPKYLVDAIKHVTRETPAENSGEE